MDALNLKIVTPKAIILEVKARSVTIPTYSGEITVLPHHTDLFSLLVEGLIKIKTGDKEDYLAIGGGYLETDGSDIHILVSKAYGQNEIDEKLINEAVKNAQKILSQSKNQAERTEAQAILRRSLIDIKLLKKRKRPLSS